MHIFRTPAKNSLEKFEDHMLTLIWKTRRGEVVISQNSQKNTRIGVSFLIKLQISGSNFIKKEIPTQGLFCAFSWMYLVSFLL